MKAKKLYISQLDRKLATYGKASELDRPTIGWVRTLRQSLGMTLEQLGKKLGVTKQSVRHLETREASGAITIRALEEVAKAMDMKLVYCFVPHEGDLMQWIEKRARAMATDIVMRTARNMQLEEQQVSYERLHKDIEEQTQEIMHSLPKSLWD